jgi:hypothetical protein
VEQLARAEVKRLSRRIDKPHYDIEQLDWLQCKEDSRSNQNLVIRTNKRYYKESAHGIDGEDIAIVEQEVEDTPQEQQHHTPYETQSKILALLRLVVVLDEEAQAKEHREDCVHLARKHKEEAIPNSLVESAHKLARSLRELVEVELLDKVNQHDTANGDTTQDIGYINS